MVTIWIRIDGVIGDVLSECNRYFNLINSMGYSCKDYPVSSIRGRSNISPICKKLMRFVSIQPELYRDMKILPGCLDAVKIMRDLGWNVKLFTDEVQKKEKELWILQNLPQDEIITWITKTSFSSLPDDTLVIDHELHICPYGRKNHEIVFYPYLLYQSTFGYPGVYTWKDDWERKIKEIISQQSFKEDK